MATTTPGDKYILFITDGEPDYCDDSNGCARRIQSSASCKGSRRRASPRS
jgi:hypothetical protein